MSAAKRPWMKWYPADWRGDPRLRMCSLAARGLWADLISYMHEGVPYGHLTIDGKVPDAKEIASLVARPLPEVKKALAELGEKQVAGRTERGILYSRRMVRDNAKAIRDHINGKGGGNPNLLDGVNLPDKAQKPEARSQNGGADAREPLPHWSAWVEIAKAGGFDIEDPNWFSQHGRVAQWLANGWDTALDIVPTVQRVTANRKGKSPIRRLEFFEEAIADAYASRTAPVPEGKPVHVQANRRDHPAGAWGAARDDFRAARADLKAGIAAAGEGGESR